MSPPLAATEKQKDAKTKVRRKKTMTPTQLRANRANARLSRGPVSQAGKDRSRLSKCKHNLRSELPILPGENSEELNRRLDVWPGLLGAEGEIEEAVATRAVHTFWRLERADLSEDATAERVILAIDKELEERDAEEVRQLEAQLDSHDDPQGVVRKLKRSPAGCRLLIQEFRCLHDRMEMYNTLFWSQRMRLFHLLGKREGDLFTGDPVITQWMVGLIGTVFGDDPEKLDKVSETLDGLRPVWMGDIEYGQRMQFFVAALPGQDLGQEMVFNLVAAAIADLNERLDLAEASARHERALAFKAARVDDSAAGARRLSYKMRHDGAFHAALRRLDAMKKIRWAGLAADEEDATGATEAAVTGSSPAVANDPITAVANDPITAVANDPITAVTNDPIRAETNDSILVATTIPVPADASNPGTDEEGGPADADQPLRRWTDVVPLSTCRREGSLLSSDPEKEAAELAQMVDQALAYAKLSALRAGGAKPAQSGEQTLAQPAHRGPETNLPTLHASRPTPHASTPDPLLAVIQKYQKEFDAELRPCDHLE